MRARTRWAVALLGPAAALVVTAPVAASTSLSSAQRPAPYLGETTKSVGGRYIVVLKTPKGRRGDLDATRNAPAIARAKANGGRVEREYRHALHGFAATLNADQLAAVRRDPDVAYVEADRAIKEDEVFGAVGDQTGATWGIDRIDQRALPLNGEYTYGADGSGVTAYVIDSGIRTTHQQFGGRAVGGFDAVRDWRGTDDCTGHGTHVAGTIGGSTYGVAKNVRLVAVRVLNCDRVGTWAGIIEGIDWVTANHSGPSVANMSLGGDAMQSADDAVTRSIDSGVAYVVAAGSNNGDACLRSPARTPDALTVAASTRDDSRDTQYSNWGSCVDLFAPGVDITTAFKDSDTAIQTKTGTSMAAPHVAGAVALYLQRNPAATPAQVRSGVVGTATANVVNNANGSPNLLVYAPGAGKVPTPPSPTGPTDRLLSGQALLRGGQGLTSPDGRFTLTLQGSDGNLVLYEYETRPLWSIAPRDDSWVINQPDGNVVAYRADNYYTSWSTGTAGEGPSTLVLQNDGNLVLYRNSDNKPVWGSDTCCHRAAPQEPATPTDRLLPGQGLVRGGAKLTSPDGRFTLVLQRSDGNLVLYQNGTQPLWAFGPRDDSWVINQPDGNLVAYLSEGPAVWASGTNGHGASTLVMQNDGNLVLYRNRDGVAVWSTETCCR